MKWKKSKKKLRMEAKREARMIEFGERLFALLDEILDVFPKRPCGYHPLAFDDDSLLL